MEKAVIVWIVVFFFISVILIALGTGLFYIIRGRGDAKKTARSLTVRIACSLSLFFLLFLAFAMGWIQPHGIKPPGLQPVNQDEQQ